MNKVTKNTRIGIVDDHPTIVLGTTAILNAQRGLNVVAAGQTVAELLAVRTSIDIVLLDLALGDGSEPADNVYALRRADIQVVAFTSGERPQLIREASRAGAIGMIRKSERPDRIIAALRGVVSGEVVATADWAAALDADPELASAALSGRESEVLALYAAGETADRVAAKLFISRDTVNDHIRRIRSKYAAVDRPARTKVDLYRRAIEDGLVQPEA